MASSALRNGRDHYSINIVAKDNKVETKSKKTIIPIVDR